MKKSLKTFISLILVFCTLIIVGCKNKDNFIDLPVYLYQDVNYTNIISNTGYQLQLDKFINQNNENEIINQYNEIKFTTKKDYSLGLKVHYITFDIYSTTSATIEIITYITNMENAKYNSIYSAKTFEIATQCPLKENEFVSVKIDIEDTFGEGISYIIFKNNSLEQFYTNNQFKYSISNLKICAEHELAEE